LKTVAAILRAADALEFDQFKTFAVSYLRNGWPADFAKFNGGIMEHAVDAAILGWKYGVDSALKRALYEFVRADSFKPHTGASSDEDDRLNKTVKLHYSWLVHAREQLMAFWMPKAVPPKQKKCASPRGSDAQKHCAMGGAIHIPYTVLVHDSGTFFRYRHDPIMGLQALIDAPWLPGEVWPSTYPQDLPTTKSHHRLCVGCADIWRAMWRSEKEVLWHVLDTWFGLVKA